MLDIENNKKDSSSTINTGKSPSLITQQEIVGINQISQEKIVQIFSLIILVIFVAMTIFVFVLASSKKTVLKNKEANFQTLEQQLSNDPELSATEKLAQQFDGGLKKVSGWLARRPSWSLFLKELQSLTPTSIVYKSLNINEKTLVATVSGEANDYNSLGLLLASVRDSEKLSTGKLISATQAKGENNKISFNIEFTILENKLK